MSEVVFDALPMSRDECTFLQAVILAGGRGERLRPLTDTSPKPMMLVNGYPFLWHLVSRLKRDGFNDLVLCVGYLARQITDYFGDGTPLSVHIRYSVENDFLGTGGALRNALPLLERRFMLLNGDTYADMPYKAVAESHSSEPILMVVSTNPINTRNVFFEDDKVREYGKASQREFNASDAGVYVMSHEVIKGLGPSKSSLEADLFPSSALSRAIGAYPIEARYYDIGTIARLHEFRTYASSHNLGSETG